MKLLSINSQQIAFVFIAVICCTSCSHYITEQGKASYYADKFEGRSTASGEIFKQNKCTAAHKTLPFGTRVKVINLTNNKKVKVTINDRGPYAQGRIIDLTEKAADKIDMLKTGVANVEIRYKRKKK